MLALAPQFDPVPSPPALPVSRLSYSSLASYARCGYRFHLERVAGLHASDDALAGADEPGDIGALTRGTVVHELLEHTDMTVAEVPDNDRIAAVIGAHGGRVSAETLTDVRALLRGFAGSPTRYFARPIKMEERLPTIRVPLDPGVPLVPLDLQPLLDRAYDTGRYPRLVRYTAPCDPPLTAEQQVWAESILRGKGLLP